MLFSNTLVKEETISAENLSSISANSHQLDIKIHFTDSDEITIRQYDIDSNNTFHLSAENGRLSINVASYTRLLIFNFSLNPRLEIYLPRSYSGAVSLSTTSGAISGAAHADWGETVIQTSSGSIKLEDGISCTSLSAESFSGSIKIGAIYSSGDASAKTSSGSLRLEDITAAQTISLSSFSGSVSTGDISCQNLHISTNSGALRIERMDVSDFISIKTSSGSQKIGNISTAVFAISATSGSIKYDSLSGGGSLSTSSGSINIELAHFTADTALSSNSGSVRVKFSNSQNAELNLSTSSGSIKTGSLELLYDKSGRSSLGSVGTGEGCNITIKTSSGSIKIS